MVSLPSEESMNNVLFGVIGLLMLTITGIGYAEVKTQMAGQSETSPEEIGDSSDTANTSTNVKVASKVLGASVQTDATVESDIATTVPEVLAQVAQKVEMALFGGWEDEDRHEDEGEDEEDEDDRPSKSSQKAVPTTAAPAPKPTAAPAASGTATLTMADIASHNSAASCYSAINGSVYNLTSFVTKHPGGQAAIKSICGVDGTAAFSGQHGGQGTPASVLVQYKIGVVK